MKILEDDNFIEKNDESNFQLTVKGKIASTLNECNSLAMANIIFNNHLDDCTLYDIVSFMSCFTNISVPDEARSEHPTKNIELIKWYSEYKNKFEDLENYHRIHTGNEEDIHFDLIDEMYDWCKAENEEECKVVTDYLYDKGIFIGEFVKAILKINNLANECISACEYLGNIKLSESFHKIADVTLKYVVLQQSLYL